MTRKKRRGHFCWVCGCIKSNESFSGRGHSKHICKECSKLSASELVVRQGIRNMDECFFGLGRLRRKSRTTFDRFLEHPNSKIREYALRCQMEIEDEKQRYRQMLELDSDIVESWEYDIDHCVEPTVGCLDKLPF